MKKIVSLLLAAAMISFVAVSCKKYEEGPTFSLASKKGRVAGKWTIEKVVEQDQDVTADYQSFVTSIEFTKDGDVTFTTIYGSETAKWEFDDKKENIVITHSDNSTDKFEILRLKQKELWFKDSSDPNDVIEMHLKQ